ncbi:hypothetical protein EHV15_01990 [Paenibacillus oralis]|uniref:Uncharacterized protein n=1 Tax=Paenibacillus oralis TaxID=2490856 RepID=A0A3P3TVV4_9BACL|nr:YwqJ-related putative deaminase [Paenibacillus oralis]RRJ61884.1 hypothetical protein EHV15_01990 [Paenibacillus oralis]
MGGDWYQGDGFQLLWPYDHQGIQRLKIVHQFNDHARCHFTVRMTEEQAHACLFQGSLQDAILIQKLNEAGKEYWFAGGIYQLEMVVEDGIYFVVVEGISRSYELDIHPESRSFQNKGATYTHVIKQLVQGHPKGDAQNEATEPGATIGELIVQYQETNWQFMKRLASRVGTVILPDLVMDAPRIYFGVPDFSWGKDMKAYSYTMMQDMGSYLSYLAQAAGNESLRLLEADCIQYQVKSKYYYQVGENVGFKRQIWVIYGSMITYDQGSIQYEYVLVQRKAIRRKSKVNQAIQGEALEGKVVSRANNMVKVHLDIDEQHDKAGSWWFPYSAEGNNIFHSLPDEGAKVKVYFPSGIEKQAIAVNSARGSSEEMVSRTVFQKPTTKVFHIPGNTKMELGEDGVLFKKDTVKINLEGGNIQVEANEDLLVTVGNELKLISQKEESEEGDSNKSKSSAMLPRSIKFTAKNMIAMQILMDQYILITNSFVSIRSKKIDFNKVDIPFVDMLTEDELKELYLDELKNDKDMLLRIYNENWSESDTVSAKEIQAVIKAKAYEDPNAIQNAKAWLGKKDQNELQAKYLSRGKQDSEAKSEEKSEEELTIIKNNYVTRYNQTNKLMSASYHVQKAETDEERTEAYNQYTQVFEEMQKSGLFANDAEGKGELSKYFSKNVPEMLYYSRFNFERIVISGQYGSVLMGVFFVATGIIAIVASAPSAGNSVLLWSLMVGDVVWSAGQMYVSLEKLDDLGKGYANTEPEIFGLNQSDLDNLGLLLTAVNLSILAKHGVTKTLDAATDANRIKLLDDIAKREGWDNLGKNFAENLKRLGNRGVGEPPLTNGNFTPEEIINLKNHVIEEAQMLKDVGLTNTQLGPAVAGVYDRTTGRYFTAINDLDGDIPKELHPLLEPRIKNMPKEVHDSYERTRGAGSHAEVYAVNKALLANPDVDINDLLVYVIKPGGKTKPVTDIPFHTCPHCNYILSGFNVLSDF